MSDREISVESARAALEHAETMRTRARLMQDKTRQEGAEVEGLVAMKNLIEILANVSGDRLPDLVGRLKAGADPLKNRVVVDSVKIDGDEVGVMARREDGTRTKQL